MCFSPQRRTIFQHLNFQKWSRIVSFLTFSLPNVLFATAACNFSTSELPKVVRTCGVLYILTCECAFRHSGVQFLMSPLSTYLRTRRFNRPTFGLTRHTNLWKNTAFRDFSNIWRGCIFFRLTFWLLHLLSTDLITLLLLFNSPYCRKFLFKLPSIILPSLSLKRKPTQLYTSINPNIKQNIPSSSNKNLSSKDIQHLYTLYIIIFHLILPTFKALF